MVQHSRRTGFSRMTVAMLNLERALLIVTVAGMFYISALCESALCEPTNLDDELKDLGVDMCPEKSYNIQQREDQGNSATATPLGLSEPGTLVPGPISQCLTPADMDEAEESMGVEMCPEKEYKSLLHEKHEAFGTEVGLGHRESNRLDQLQTIPKKQLTNVDKILKQQQAQVAKIDRLIQALNRAVTRLNDIVQNQQTLERSTIGHISSQIGSLGEDGLEHTGASPLDLSENNPGIPKEKVLEAATETEQPLDGSPYDYVSSKGEPVAPYSSVAQEDNRQSSARSEHGGRTIARYKAAWSDFFHFLSAVKVDSIVSCLHVLPHEGEDGISRYVAVGDESGQVYLFLAYGDLLLHHKTLSPAPVTCMLSYVLRNNETILITGHSDGAVLMHRICETLYRGPSSGDDWHALSMEYMHSLASPPGGTRLPSLAAMYGVETENAGLGCGTKYAEDCDTVTNIEMYRVGRMRYILVSDVGGKIQVYRENGSLYGVAQSPSRPLAFLRTPNTQRLLFLTETGAGSLDLRNMTVRSSPCEGLNDTRVVAYTFDAAGRSKAYGFTAGGDLIYVALSGDTFHFKCQVGTKRKLDLNSPLVPHAIKGYLLVSTPQHLYVYNTTLQVGFNYANVRAGGTRPVVTSSVDDIVLSFMNPPVQQVKWPVMAGNRDKLVVLGFGDGYIGIYMSNLPVQKPGDFNARMWSSPIFFSILVMFIAWFYFSRKKDFGLNGNSDIMFGSTPVTGGLTFENTRAASKDSREGVTEGRRYTSPARVLAPNQSSYGAAGAITFRGTKADTTSSYSARREPLFSSTNPVGEIRH